MSKGIINPKGKINLGERNRDMTPPYWGESDKSLGLSKEFDDLRRGKNKGFRPKKKKKLTTLKDARRAKQHRNQIKAKRRKESKKSK